MCGGGGCVDCDDRGSFEVTRCPQLEITADVIEAVELAGMMRRGLPPVTGGSLDQAEQFLEAARLIWREEDFWRGRLDPLVRMFNG